MLQPITIFEDRDKHLAARIAKGDTIAFDEFFNKYYRSLFTLIIKYVKDEKLAEDILQDVFSKIWNNRTSINPEASLKNYIYTITKNHVLNVLRDTKTKSKRILEYTQLHHPVPEHVQEEESVPSELSQSVFKAIDQLPKKRRVITKLKLYKGLSNEAVATKMKLSIHTVKSQYSLALKQLRSLSTLFRR